MGFAPKKGGSCSGMRFEGRDYLGQPGVENWWALTCDPKSGRVVVAEFSSQHGFSMAMYAAAHRASLAW